MPAIPAFLAGQILTADLLNSLVDDLNDLTGWAVTTGDSAKTTITLGTVTGLVVPLDANSNYVIEGVFYIDGPTANDIKFNTTQPAGLTGTHKIQGADAGVATTRFNALDLGTSAVGGGSIVVGCIGAGTILAVHYTAEVVTVGTAGNYQITAAQNVAGGTSNVKAGSRLRAVKRP